MDAHLEAMRRILLGMPLVAYRRMIDLRVASPEGRKWLCRIYGVEPVTTRLCEIAAARE